MATATSSAGTSHGSNEGHTTVADGNTDCARYRTAREHDALYRVTLLERSCGYSGERDPNTERSIQRGGATNEPGAWVAGFAGAQKVFESDGSVSVALSVIDQRFRLNGSFTQYFETEMNGDHINMMAPELSAGLRLGAIGPTRLWVEAGAMYLKTNDPRGNSSSAGPSVGVRLEQHVSDNLDGVATVEGAYLQDGMRAWAGRVGVRFHHVEAAFRVLDLNVGPALYGPEIGVGF